MPLNPSDPLNTKEIDAFLAQVKKVEEAAKKLVENTTNSAEPTSNPNIQTAQVIPENTKKYLKWAIFAGAGYALYEVFTAGEKETK
jgi:hypothetical protein